MVMKSISNDHSDSDVHASSGDSSLNRLRAAVLGANDGIVSVSSIVVGVAGATNKRATIFTAGLAGLVAGALSMAVGEYVSVSTQRDTQKAFIDHERWELETKPESELEELANIYKRKGVSEKLAKQLAKELTANDALAAHLDAELNIDPDDLTSPWQAAFASLTAFTIGAIIPLVSIVLASRHSRFVITFIAVVLALIITGYFSAKAGGSAKTRAIIRVVTGGILAMIVTFLIGKAFGTAVH
jgi:VIT1/CCC1 family predicted Fe2+/Mn2+ transporter